MSRRIESRFLTLFLGALSPDGRLTFCNAGQNPPLLFTRNGTRRLETGGTLVGAFEIATYDSEELQLRPGDTLVLYSDGITEAMNVAGEEFGEDRVCGVVQGVLGESPELILKAVFEAVAAFARGAPQHDDLTAVVLRFRPLS